MPSNMMKSAVATPLVFCRRLLFDVIESWRRVYSFAALKGRLTTSLPASTVVLGPVQVCGSGRVCCGEELLIYPNQYMETQEEAEIVLGDSVVLSTGVHLVAYAGIYIGEGTMI